MWRCAERMEISTMALPSAVLSVDVRCERRLARCCSGAAFSHYACRRVVIDPRFLVTCRWMAPYHCTDMGTDCDRDGMVACVGVVHPFIHDSATSAGAS